MTEGALDPSAYAQVDGPGIGGARLAAIEVSDTNIDLITFEDPEANFSNTLGGTAVVAPLQPLVAEPGTDNAAEARRRPFIYTIEDGDTVAGIAARFNVSENTVLWANGLSSRDVLKVGDHLTILPITGVLHTVQSGDTVVGIAKKYDAKAEDIVKDNDLEDSSSISTGRKLLVRDGAIAPASTPRIVPSGTISDPNEAVPPPVVAEGSGLLRPVGGYVSQHFGRWGHSGTDIAGNAGQTIHAALAGTVDFSGWQGGYGKVVKINHGNGLQTLYAHASTNYVSTGQAVNKGDAISRVGTTGRSSGDHLHFEVMQNGNRVNPCSLISC